MATAVARQISAIRESAEKMDARETATIGAASIGDIVRQGDIYLVCLESAPAGEKAETRQLAPGTTQGSRHIAEGDCDVLTVDQSSFAEVINRTVRGAAVPSQLVGPAIVCRGETTITHPEHGHRVLPGGSNWATVYQRAFAEEIRRTQD